MRHPAFTLLVLLAVLARPAPAVRAQPRPGEPRRAIKEPRPGPAIVAEARRRFGRGNALYRMGNYREALLLYQAALDLYREPVILYNIAQTHEKLRNPAQAALHFEEYLKASPKSADSAAVKERIDRLRRMATVEVQVTSYPPGAAIYVGARERGVRGRTPFPLDLPLGDQRVIVELAGFVPEERTINVVLGERNILDVQLRRRSSIKVDADVPGARATLISRNGQQTQRLPHLFEPDPGTYPIVVELAGYHPVRHQVELLAGDQISLLVNLKPLPEYGRLQIEGVAGATVVLEERTFAHLPMGPKPVPAGTHLVSVGREGYQTWEAKINVAANRLTVARVRLSPLRGRVATAVVYSSAGVAAGALVTGAIFGVLALGTERDYKGAAADVDTQRTGRMQATLADVFFGVAGAAAATAAITFFATRRGPSTAEFSFSDPAKSGHGQ